MGNTSFQPGSTSVLRQFASGVWYPMSGGGTTNSTAQGNGTLKAFPFEFRQHGVINALAAAWSTAGQAESTLRLGVYADTGTGLPGALLLDAGAKSTAGDTVIQDWTGLSLAVRANTRVWFAAVIQGAPTTQPNVYQVSTSPPTVLALTADATLPAVGLGPRVSLTHADTVSGALPATFNPTGNSGSITRILFKLA